jgi:hypothetical protein
LFDWGKRGLGIEMADASVLHKSCGKPLRILVICENCKEVAIPRDVEVVTENTRRKSSSAPKQNIAPTSSPSPLPTRTKVGARGKTMSEPR